MAQRLLILTTEGVYPGNLEIRLKGIFREATYVSQY